MKNKKVAIYARVNSNGQVGDRALNQQIKEIKERVSADGLETSKEAIFSDKASAMDLKRPGLNDMLRELVKEKFSKIYIYDASRLTRSFQDDSVLRGKLYKAGVEIVYLH